MRPSGGEAGDGGQISSRGRGRCHVTPFQRDSLILSLKDYELSTWQARQEGDRCGLCPPELAGWWAAGVKKAIPCYSPTGGSQGWGEGPPPRKGCQEVAPLNFQSEGKEKKKVFPSRGTREVPRLGGQLAWVGVEE